MLKINDCGNNVIKNVRKLQEFELNNSHTSNINHTNYTVWNGRPIRKISPRIK